MRSQNRLLDDLARLTSGAAGVMAGLRQEIEGQVRARLDRLLAEMDLVRREEFEVVKAMAAKARTEQEALEQRVRALEGGKAPAAASAAKTGEDD